MNSSSSISLVSDLKKLSLYLGIPEARLTGFIKSIVWREKGLEISLSPQILFLLEEKKKKIP